MQRKKPSSVVVTEDLNRFSHEVRLSVENTLFDKVDEVLPSNQFNDSPSLNKIDENVISNNVDKVTNEFDENVPPKIVADKKSKIEFDKKGVSNLIGNQATEDVAEKLPSNEVDVNQD